MTDATISISKQPAAAEAMTGDREKCLGAGASDYISKPVNNDQPLSLMRVWLFR
jgi:CheY-like chemotaxis protein